MLKLLTRFKKKEYFMILIAIAFIVAGVWLDLRIPEFTEEILTVANPENGRKISEIWGLGGWMVLCTFASMITVVIVGYLSARISASYSANLRKDIFDKVSAFSTAEMKQFSVPSLITRSTNDVTQVRMFIAMGLQLLIKAPITAAWAITKILGRSRELSTATAIAVVALVLVIVFLIIIVLPRFRKIQTLTDNLNKVARENLTGIRVVRAYNAEEHETERFAEANSRLTKNNLFTYRAMGIMSPFMTLLMSGLGLAIWWIGASVIHKGQVNPAEFIPGLPVFMTYSAQIIMSFMLLIIIFMMMPRASISARRINEVLKTKSTIESGNLSSGEVESKGTIEFRDVSFKYPDAEAYILKDINLNIKKGQTIAFIGSTGSGKSTLVNLIPRIYDATDGDILINDINLNEYSLEALNDKVGYVPQTAVIFKGTIASNVAFGSAHGTQPDENEIWKALEVSQAVDFVKKMPDGLNSEVSQGGRNLSGGQKQRLAIARVVARKPEILIFDDTFSALDYKTDKLLREALRRATKDATVLIVAQRIGTIKNADQIIVLDSGIVVGKGTHKELLKSCEIYKEIAYSQLSKEELA